MKISVLQDSQLIKDFLLNFNPESGAEFLASLEWSKINSEMTIYGVFDDNNRLLAVFNLSRKRIGLGWSYCYSPRGPLVLENNELVWQFLIDYFKKESLCFWRLEPLKLPVNFSFVKTINLQPAQTLLLDLNQDKEALLTGMHQKTRYNIRLAEKKNLMVIEGKTAQDFEDFWSLMSKTGERDSFRIHDKKHYYNLATINPDFIKLFLVKQGQQTLAAGLWSFYGDKVTYLHGASDHQARQLMAPYLLQWKMIESAKQNGYRYYDFFGIDPKKWPGVTRFKLGFGGRIFNYAGTYDLVFNPLKYFIYNLARRLKRFI